MTKEELSLGMQALYDMARTGWPPGLLQDDSKELSRWLATRPDARHRLREALRLLDEQENKHDER